jgi:hypothetical protein
MANENPYAHLMPGYQAPKYVSVYSPTSQRYINVPESALKGLDASQFGSSLTSGPHPVPTAPLPGKPGEYNYDFNPKTKQWDVKKSGGFPLKELALSIGLPALAFGGASLLGLGAGAAAGGAAAPGAFGTAGMAGATGAGAAAGAGGLAGLGTLATNKVAGAAPAALAMPAKVGGAAATAAGSGGSGALGTLGKLAGGNAGKIAGAGLGVLGLLDQRSQRGAAEDFMNAQLELRKRQLALAEQDYAGRAPMRDAGQSGLLKLAQALGTEGSMFRNRRANEAPGQVG